MASCFTSLALARPLAPRSIHSTNVSDNKLFTVPLVSKIQPRVILIRAGPQNDAVGSWLDLAGFVATSTSSAHTPFDDLADKIGRDCYIDVAGWHLYLKDVKLGGQLSMAQGIAQQLGAQIQGQGFKAADVETFLTRVPVKLGQGNATLSLADVMPAGCVRDLLDVCEDYSRR